MARILSYTQIPIAFAKSIKFAEVLETSWDTARWDDAASAVMVHWEGKIPPTIQSILKQTGGTVKNHSDTLTLIKSPEGQAKWGSQPSPPKKNKKK